MQVSCSKATTLEGSFAPAWLGFGNAYAAQDESDQAMAAYRTAARLFAGYYIGFVLYYLWVHNGLWCILTSQNFFELFWCNMLIEVAFMITVSVHCPP